MNVSDKQERFSVVNRWTESEVFEFQERSHHIFIIMAGVASWLSSFRFWAFGRKEDAFLPLGLLLALSLSLIIRKKSIFLSTRLFVLVLIISVLVESILHPGKDIDIFYFIPIGTAALTTNPIFTILAGFFSIALSISSQINVLTFSAIDPNLIVLLLFTGLMTLGSMQISSSISQAMFYYFQARGALLEARNHQGRLARAVKSLEESNSRLNKAYEAIAVAQNEADLSRQTKIRFANMISHEMRAPLNFIIGATALMANSPETYGSTPWPPGLHEDIKRLYQSCNHLSNLVDDVIALGQMEANRVDLYFELCEISDVIKDAEAIISTLLEHNSLYFDIQIDPDLPMVNIDRNRIRQVFLNLLSNSYRYTSKGGITVRAKLEGDYMVISVEDTGSGISQQEISNLFKEFYQIPGRKIDHTLPSSGLGLMISRQFIELHGGQIWADSPIQEPKNGEGPGTRVTISLPIKHMELIKSIRIGRETGASHGGIFDFEI